MFTHAPDLNRARRTAELAAAAEKTVDVLVVGGGITGVGTALDAASRGLSVTLIEAEDLAFGTSRWSSKLVHGGLRYLATGDFATARESAFERHLIMTQIAPHLVRPLAQLLPFTDGVSLTQRAAGVVGMTVGDGLRWLARTPAAVLPRPRLVSAATARQAVPGLSPDGARWAMQSFDGQLVDDARLVVAIARTAAAYGARILTRVRALRLDDGGADAEDALTGERLRLRARAVINATGVWAGTLDESIRVRPSRGTHLVLDAAALGHPTAALTVPREGSISRYIFALPQQLGRVIVGLTDEDAPGPVPPVPEPTEPEITFLLAETNRVLATPLGRGDVLGAFAGLRPLIDTPGKSSADVSRRHLVAASEAGFLNILGGKLTTYRRMAEDAVDLAVRTRNLSAAASRTHSLPLVGAAAFPADREARSWRFGTESERVQREARVSDAASPVAPGIDVLRAEVEFAVRAEGALTADDVLDRRTRIGLVAADRAAAAPAVTAIVAEVLAERS